MDFPVKLLQRLPTKFPSGGGSSSSSGGAPLSRFLSLPDFLSLASSKKLVWFGEYHSEERICAILERLVANSVDRNASSGGRLHVVCEQFSFEMQDILDRYQRRDDGGGASFDFDGLVDAYREIGTEGHKLDPYRPMLEYCRTNSEFVKLHGGFLPRPYAAAYMKAGQDDEKIDLYRTLSVEKGYLPDLSTLRKVDGILGLDRDRDPSEPIELYGSPGHYNLFESLMSGRDIYGPPDDCPPPNESYRKIFQAQLMKDFAMAWRLRAIVNDSAPEDRFLVLAGRAHLSHYHGVPEIYSWLRRAESADDDRGTDGSSELLVCAQMMYECDLDEREQKENDNESERIILESELVRGSMLLGGAFERPTADVLYIYDEEDWEEDDDSDEEERGDGEGIEKSETETTTRANEDSDEAAKLETIDAYDKVGTTAAKQGNINKARAILTHLGYTPEEQEVIGEDDIYNYQGVGNPFPLARIEAGERVIDLGSGLGVDSFLAAHYVGSEGEVLGVDISRKQVMHANDRAAMRSRKVSNCVSFRTGDIENLSGVCAEDHFDVAISNGAFCLAPNKRRAFENVYRVLKPGGRMSVCTTTVKKDLDVETQWPLCMRMFIHLNKIQPMCEKIGFKNVRIDMEDPELEFELEGVTEEDFVASDESGRAKIHVGSSEFKHLQDYDMNDICARVVVYGEK